MLLVPLQLEEVEETNQQHKDEYRTSIGIKEWRHSGSDDAIELGSGCIRDNITMTAGGGNSTLGGSSSPSSSSTQDAPMDTIEVQVVTAKE
jgi:hypothetical protein